MIRRSTPGRLVMFALILFMLAACGAPGAGDAAAESNALAEARFADQQADGIHGWLAAASALPTVGTTNVDAYLESDDGQPIEDATVTFDVDMTNMSHGKTLVSTRAIGGGHYTGDVHFSMLGPWRIIATVERPGQAPVQLRFDFRVQVH